MKLYRKTRTGAIQVLDISTKGAQLISVSSQLNGKKQTTLKTCKAMSVGKKNEKSPAQQAKLEMKAKIVKKMKEGYTSTIPSKKSSILAGSKKIDLDNLPPEFCPNKPIGQSSTPKSILESPTTYGQRKRDGHCLFIIKGKKKTKVTTRRMEDITEYVKDIPFIKAMIDKVNKGSFDLFECTFYHNEKKREIKRYVQQVISKKNAEEAMARYKELSKIGTFHLWPLDTMFQKHEFVGDHRHINRAGMLMINEKLEVEECFPDWKAMLDQAKKEGWEGMVLRDPWKSLISYTMDGKAHKAGSYKYKFVKEGDFFVDEVLMGESGKHAGFYAKFHLAQYDEDGKYIDRGYCGCGTFSHEQLAELTKDIDSGKLKVPFVFQVEYQSIQDESGKLEFGQPQGDVGVRSDKTPAECISEE